jgi:hypothetical protein
MWQVSLLLANAHTLPPATQQVLANAPESLGQPAAQTSASTEARKP